MELTFRGSFGRDYRSINDRLLIKALKDKILEVKKAKDILHVSRFKQLRKYRKLGKIEVRTESNKIYWILCIASKNRVEFVRVKSEVYFKKNL